LHVRPRNQRAKDKVSEAVARLLLHTQTLHDKCPVSDAVPHGIAGGMPRTNSRHKGRMAKIPEVRQISNKLA